MAKKQGFRIKDKVKCECGLPPSPLWVRIGKYLLLAYWLVCISIFLTVDLFVDLYTDWDSIGVLWSAILLSLPPVAITLYFMRKEFLGGRWYTYILYPVISFGIYLCCSYFTLLNADLMLSAAFKSETAQILPIQHVQQVIARKAGFIHTDVTLLYQGKPVVFQGTRTSYFLLIGKKELQADLGQSYLGNLYALHLKAPAHERWLARGAYLYNWFHRYLWLMIASALLFVFGLLKDKFFPKPILSTQTSSRLRKFFDVLLIVILSIIGLTILVLLLAYFFL